MHIPKARQLFTTDPFKPLSISAPLLWYLMLLAISPAIAADTFYVRTDGGTSTQCTGRSDAPYPGSGTNRSCAWAHPFVALPPGDAPRIDGGDTLRIGPGDYAMGVGAPGDDNCYSQFSWDCHMPPIPAGPDPDNPTRITGTDSEGACTNPPELWGNERPSRIISLDDSHNVELACLEITDRDACIEFHCHGGGCSEANACQRNEPPFGAWASIGISARDSDNVELRDLRIHGLANAGIHAGRIRDWRLVDVAIVANGWVGWDGDVGQDSSNAGTLLFDHVEIAWNGCGETYPDGTIQGCWAQGAGGFGDGLGTASTGGHWIFRDVHVHHNTSDGIDLLHSNDNLQVTVQRALVENNAGQQVKTGRGGLIENSVIIGNCGALADYPNMQGSDNCRALGDTVSVGLESGSSTMLINNTIVGQGNCLVSGSGGSSASSVTLANNVLIGNDYWHDPNKLSCLFYADGGDDFWTNNLVHNVRNDACPEGSVCDAGPGVQGPALEDFDWQPIADGPLVDAADPNVSPDKDFRTFLRPAGNGPDIGAIEHGADAAVLRLNAGLDAPITVGALQWQGDAAWLVPGSVATASALPDAAIGGTVDDALYQTVRIGSPFGYEIPVADGTYRVRLHFAELWHGVSTDGFEPGDRVFDVVLEGEPRVTGFDLALAAGAPLTAHTIERDVVVDDGVLDVGLELGADGVDQATVSALEVFTVDTAPPPPPPPQTGTVDATPDAMGFGSVTVGQTTTQAVVLANPGEEPVTISALNVDDPQGEFALQAPPTLPLELAAGTEVTLTMAFDPIDAGTAGGLLSVTHDGANGPLEVSLEGLGEAAPPPDGAPLLRLNAGVDDTITVGGVEWRPGSEWLDPGSLGSVFAAPGAAIAGTDDDALYQTERYGNPFGYEIPMADGNYRVRLHFAEIWHGVSTAGLEPGDRVFDIVLEGESRVTGLDLAVAAGAPLTAHIIELDVVVDDGVLDVELALGANGVDQAKLSALEVFTVDTAPPPPQPGTVDAAPDAVDFGSITVGETTTQAVVLANPGEQPVTITALSVDDPQGEFALQAPPALPLELAAGTEVTLSTAFAPVDAGTAGGLLTVTHDGANGPAEVSLAGLGEAAPEPGTVDATPDALNFGSVIAGETATAAVTLTNSGEQPVTITALSADDAQGEFALQAPPALPLELAAGAEVTLSTAFAPVDAGTAGGLLTVTHDGENGPLEVSLEGLGEAAPPPDGTPLLRLNAGVDDTITVGGVEWQPGSEWLDPGSLSNVFAAPGASIAGTETTRSIAANATATRSAMKFRWPTAPTGSGCISPRSGTACPPPAWNRATGSSTLRWKASRA